MPVKYTDEQRDAVLAEWHNRPTGMKQGPFCKQVTVPGNDKPGLNQATLRRWLSEERSAARKARASVSAEKTAPTPRRPAEANLAQSVDVSALYEQIGRLTVENAELRRRLGG